MHAQAGQHTAEFLRRLIESSQDCIKVLDLEGRILSMNEGGRRLLEMDSVEPFIGTPWVDLWRGGHADRAAEAVAAAQRGEVVRFEDFGPTMRGTPRWWDTMLAPINGADGRPERLLAVSRDVTDRVEAERAKDEFLATLAHELRNPLAAILNGVAALDSIGSQEASPRNIRDIMRRQTQHMAALLDDLLDVARIGEGKIVLQREVVDLVAIVRAAVDGEMPRIGRRRQQLQVDAAPGGVFVRGDAVRLRQIAANLLNNASKYTPDEGRIRVAVLREGDDAMLRVSDTGVGIPRDRLEDVFELFTQVARTEGRTEGGLGIGLTLVRRLALLHGGEVVAESDGPGFGSRFTVRMPAVEGLRASAQPSAAAKARPEVIVLIEDQDDTRELLTMSLAQAGHTVAAAPTAAEGLRLVAERRPSVVITDIGLPDMDGYAVAEAARRTLGDACMLVAFSGYGQARDRERSTAAGFDVHVLKPVDPARLLEVIAAGRGRPSA